MRNEQLEISDEEAIHVFSNLVSFNINAEEVCMGMGIRDVKEAALVNVHTYMHMTIPHFVRFVEAVNQQLNVLIERGIVTREPEQ